MLLLLIILSAKYLFLKRKSRDTRDIKGGCIYYRHKIKICKLIEKLLGYIKWGYSDISLKFSQHLV